MPTANLQSTNLLFGFYSRIPSKINVALILRDILMTITFKGSTA